MQPANCTKAVYDLLKGRPDASAFLAAAAKTGAASLVSDCIRAITCCCDPACNPFA